MIYSVTGRKLARGVCIVGLTAIAMWSVGTTASAAPAPIKVGGLLTEGAAVGFPTSASRTLKAFFKDYNARGGFKGRKIQVVIGNEGFSVERSFGLTKQMIDDGVVAFVGSTAFTNCLANAGLYLQANVYTIGYSGGQQCYGLKVFGAVNASSPTQEFLAAEYAKRRVGGKVCLIGYSVPGGEAVYQRAVQMLAKVGTTLAYQNTGLPPTGDPTAALLEAKNAGCRSVLAQLSLGQNIQLANARAAQRIRNVDLVFLNGMDSRLLKGTGKNAEGTYHLSQTYPVTVNDSKTKPYLRLMSKYHIAADNFSVVPYISSQLFLEALKRVRGSITRRSVGAAIAKLNVTNSLLPGGQFRFGGGGSGNAPVTGAYMAQVKNGKYVKAANPELTVPRSVRSLAGR